jgi:hypothetical protein
VASKEAIDNGKGIEKRSGSAAGRIRRVAFFVVVGLFALMCTLLGPVPYAVLGWFLEPGVVSHRVHETSFGLIFALSLVGALAQLRKPEDKIAAMYQVVLPIYLTIAAVVILDRQLDPIILAFLAVPLLLVVLHPDRRRLFRPPIAPSGILAVLALVVAIPLVLFAGTEFRIGQRGSSVARNVIEDLPQNASEKQYGQALSRAAASREILEAARHYGHWSAMGAFALSIVALAVLAALRVPGWRLPAWSAAIAAATYGASSLAAPADASAAVALWAILAIAWAITFIVVAEREHRTARSLPARAMS